MKDLHPYCPWCFIGKVFFRYSPTGKQSVECSELCGFSARFSKNEYQEMIAEQMKPSKKEDRLSRENDAPEVD